MKIKKPFLLALIFAAVLVVIPLARVYVFGLPLRQVPGAIPPAAPTQEPTLAGDAEITFDYGYYPDDQWVEAQCGFYVTPARSGELVLRIYYPFAITGDQAGHVFVDGAPYTDFTVTADNFEVRIPLVAQQKAYIQINSDFAKEPGAEDKRALAFVLLGTDFQSAE